MTSYLQVGSLMIYSSGNRVKFASRTLLVCVFQPQEQSCKLSSNMRLPSKTLKEAIDVAISNGSIQDGINMLVANGWYVQEAQEYFKRKLVQPYSKLFGSNGAPANDKEPILMKSSGLPEHPLSVEFSPPDDVKPSLLQRLFGA